MTVRPTAIGADEDVAVRLRTAPGPSVVAVIAAPDHAADRAVIRAQVAAAALHRAPAVRVNAVMATAAAAPGAISAAAAFLAKAAATTGQTIDVGS